MRQRHAAVSAALAQPEAETLGDRVHMSAAGRGKARRPGAHPHVPRPARHQQIVIERRDPVDRRLRHARHLGRVLAVLVGDLAVILDGGLQHRQRRRRVHAVVAADQLNQVARQRLSFSDGPSWGADSLSSGSLLNCLEIYTPARGALSPRARRSRPRQERASRSSPRDRRPGRAGPARPAELGSPSPRFAPVPAARGFRRSARRAHPAARTKILDGRPAAAPLIGLQPARPGCIGKSQPEPREADWTAVPMPATMLGRDSRAQPHGPILSGVHTCHAKRWRCLSSAEARPVWR